MRYIAFGVICVICLILMEVFKPKVTPQKPADKAAITEVKDSLVKTETALEKPTEKLVGSSEKPADSSNSGTKENPAKEQISYAVKDTPESEPEKIEVVTETFRFIFNTKSSRAIGHPFFAVLSATRSRNPPFIISDDHQNR